MPALEATFITGLDPDGVREGKALASRFPNSARYVEPKSVVSELGRRTPLFMVFVSHDLTGQQLYYELVKALGHLKGQLPIMTLAMCNSGTQPAFADYTLAQRVATSLRAEVRATTRVLSFVEVGQGVAFAKSGVADFVLPSNDPTKGTAGLWITVTAAAAGSEDEFNLNFADLTLQ
jgi:hypothetical protein